MNSKQIIGFILLSASSSYASADCTDAPLTEGQLSTVISGNMACVGASGNWESQEFHGALDNLKDYKRGPDHATDPTVTVGSWAIGSDTNGGTITYTYGTNIYTYKVIGASTIVPGSFEFCNIAGGAPIIVAVKVGGPVPVSCG